DLTNYKSPKQRGYARIRVARSTDPKAFEAELKTQENRGTSETAKRFVDNLAIVLNNRTAIQVDYITGHFNHMPLGLERIFNSGLRQFAKVAIQRGREGRLTLPIKQNEDDNNLPTPEELLGLKAITETEALRIFKLLAKTSVAIERDKDGH